MSDCGIYGNKNWQRAVDKASDKPAATVHGTGSGEAKLPEGADDPELFRKQRDWLLTECKRIGITVNVAIGEDIRKAYRLSLPTPPASPTVTLDRAVYDMVTTALTSLEGLLELNNACNAAHQVRDLLALLRAAERQQ